MLKKCAALVLILLVASVTAYTQFSVSASKRYLEKDGKFFFWLGDTAWELFHRLNREEADKYLKRRSEQGFTVIQAVVLAEFDGLRVPNPYGELPLTGEDLSRPNEKYFEHVDYIISRAESYGLTVGLLPTWGDKVFRDSWGKGPEVFNAQNAAVYGEWLGKRYGDRKNIVWILGGDRNPRHDRDVEIWNAMGNAIKKATANKAIISFHPQPNPTGSSQWFHNAPWLDFNMFQTGHCRDTEVYDQISGVYNKMPVKPVLDGEPIYEDHPVCFNVKDLGTSNAFDVRKAAYLNMFAGAFGHTYGCHDIWQMYSPEREAVNGPHVYWPQAMELPGANQMSHLKKLMMSYDQTTRVPDQSLIVENSLPPAERIQATRGKDYIMVYASTGKPFTVKFGNKIKGDRFAAYWFNPRDGKSLDIHSVQNRGQKTFTPPRSGYGQDWVLVLAIKKV